ncbi:TPA: pilus assembly protein [Yersinia enterocolitica]|uniref:Protein TadG, associated with Flp pilus assembly n=4 Tax=Yersinia enterocolitica TaxID=630 RepID=A0A0H3NMU8_YERE1|nr:pilus assembly protein [Yersinia enterocolitica]AOF13745.1 tight adherance operon protein [Yersinia enterocolitica]AOF17837.1 tight adherance operon protein [Yersinia enterocolitica]AOF22371.1 tight adherance operon protein [Yersinia enterocolitica]AOF26080.1 tight adherance operon protein [Yersinia enterocolitica]AOF30192.1 tight adherance operon protein [Yersinia enterocolitica]
MLIQPDAIHKFNHFTLFKKNEQGAILISFMIIFPFFIALIFITFEISHYLQRKAKLSDAIEQATLALTIENNEIPDEPQQIKNNALVLSYVNAYLPSKKFLVPIININDNTHYLEYNAAVTMAYPAKFLSQSPFTNTISDMNITDNGVAIKNKAIEASEPTDVIFVADYSGSMLYNFNENKPRDHERIDALRSAFRKLHDIIMDNSNINAIGYIPFSWGTKRIVFENQQQKTYCHFPFSPKIHKPKGNYLSDEIKRSSNTLLLLDYIGDIIDYDKTIDSITGNAQTIDIPMSDVRFGDVCLQGSNAYSLEQEQYINNIDNIIEMEPHGWTLISSGILSANNLFKNKAKNGHKKLMIILSDGVDTDDFPSSKGIIISKMLVEKGMCEEIKENDIQMAFIAIAYSPDNNKNEPYHINWKKCVGEDNYYEAHNAHELEHKLQQAVSGSTTREVGRNIPKQ